MGFFKFIKEAGEKLFDHAAKPAQAATPDATQVNQAAADAIRAYIEKQNLGLSGLEVRFDTDSGTVTIGGEAPSREAAEKAGLAAGNVANVSSVDNRITHAAPAADAEADADKESQFHDVVSGDTLSAIAKKYYGDASKYPVIFEANKPMLTHPDKIYPGQKLRIPSL